MKKRLFFFRFYEGTNGDARQRHIFASELESNGSSRDTCLTCDEGDQCRYVSGAFSESAQHYVMHCRGPGVPTFHLRRVADPKFSQTQTNSTPNHLVTKHVQGQSYCRKSFRRQQNIGGEVKEVRTSGNSVSHNRITRRTQ